MSLKVKSEQIRTEFYDYRMASGENIYLPIKARHEEVINVHSISIYNPTAVNFADIYKIMKTKGRLRRLTHVATLNAGLIINWNIPIYLIDGEECGIAITPAGANELVEVTFQIIRMKDSEYFNAT